MFKMGKTRKIIKGTDANNIKIILKVHRHLKKKLFFFASFVLFNRPQIILRPKYNVWLFSYYQTKVVGITFRK